MLQLSVPVTKKLLKWEQEMIVLAKVTMGSSDSTYKRIWVKLLQLLPVKFAVPWRLLRGRKGQQQFSSRAATMTTDKYRNLMKVWIVWSIALFYQGHSVVKRL